MQKKVKRKGLLDSPFPKTLIGKNDCIGHKIIRALCDLVENIFILMHCMLKNFSKQINKIYPLKFYKIWYEYYQNKK